MVGSLQSASVWQLPPLPPVQLPVVASQVWPVPQMTPLHFDSHALFTHFIVLSLQSASTVHDPDDWALQVPLLQIWLLAQSELTLQDPLSLVLPQPLATRTRVHKAERPSWRRLVLESIVF